MKKIFFSILIYSISAILPYSLFGQSLKIMTFNIRYNNSSDGKNSWDNRKTEMSELLNYYEPDFLGMQEVLKNQLDYLSGSLEKYKFVGVGREDGKEKGEYAPIFYNSLKYNFIKGGTFWLSDTPDKISVGWDAALERICTYGLFKDKKSKKMICIYNTHFDHMGEKARLNSAKLIVNKINETENKKIPVVFMGDLNCKPENEPIKLLKQKLNYGADLSLKPLYGPRGTFSGFNEEILIDEVIDYLFVKNLKVLSYRHIDDKMKNNNFVSDHYPVIMEVQY